MKKAAASPAGTVPLVREINLLGTRIPVKGYICARDGGEYRPKPEQARIQVSILPTRFCGAHCFFCIAAPAADSIRLEPERLRRTLLLLREENCVRGISITGGEPFTDPVLLNEIISLIFEIFGYEMEITLDTNGSGILQLGMIRDLHHLDTVHISRHHWDDERNNRIFGCAMPPAAELRGVIRDIACPDLFVFNCLLIRDGIAAREDIHRYLDFALDCGVGKAAFITPSPVNELTASQQVNFEDVLTEDDSSLLFTRSYRDYDRCRCRDGVYVSPDGRLIRFYGRCTTSSAPGYCSGLVIEPDGTLRAGYHGRIIAGKEDPLAIQRN